MEEIKGTTKLVALIGSPVEHSKSPLIHNLSFQELGLDYAYMAFDIKREELRSSIDAMKTLDARGFSVTMPHKEEIIRYLDEVEEDAKLIGSVNTVVNNHGNLIGYNTDGKGFVRSLEEKEVKYIDEKIVIIGAGGAARAIAIELALQGAREILIANRTIEKAQEISSTINDKIDNVKAKALVLDEKRLKEELKDAKILINASSIGMGETRYKSVINDRDTLHKDLFVGDIIYNPAKTRFLSMAEEEGCKTMNGLGMLIYQGALAFQMWTGEEMPKKVKKKIEKRYFIG